MKKENVIKILQKDVCANIVETNKPANYFLDDQAHDFNVGFTVLSGILEIKTAVSFVKLCKGSRYKLKKNVVHAEKFGYEGIKFVSARPNR